MEETEMSRKFGASLTSEQIKTARAIEAAGVTTYSQVVKAYERGNGSQIREWIEATNLINQQRRNSAE
jgi:hypothetical protein